MKNHILTVSFVIALFLSSCNNSKKSDEVASYSYDEEKIEMSAELKAKMPEWVEEGKICYGLVVLIDKDKKDIWGKPVKAKIIQINKDAIKLKALETVIVADSKECIEKGCTNKGISKGETWDETEADFFLTKEDAVKRLKEMKLYKTSGRVTVD